MSSCLGDRVAVHTHAACARGASGRRSRRRFAGGLVIKPSVSHLRSALRSAASVTTTAAFAGIERNGPPRGAAATSVGRPAACPAGSTSSGGSTWAPGPTSVQYTFLTARLRRQQEERERRVGAGGGGGGERGVGDVAVGGGGGRREVLEDGGQHIGGVLAAEEDGVRPGVEGVTEAPSPAASLNAWTIWMIARLRRSRRSAVGVEAGGGTVRVLHRSVANAPKSRARYAAPSRGGGRARRRRRGASSGDVLTEVPIPAVLDTVFFASGRRG